MKIITVRRNEIQSPGFVTPPENGGQIVTVSYGCTEDCIIEHRYDASDASESYTAFCWPRMGEFNPQNGAPKLGRRLGDVRMIG